MSYDDVKKEVISVIDEFTKEDLVDHYGSIFNAQTKLGALRIPPQVRGWMSRPLNKRLAKRLGRPIRNIGMIDLQGTKSVGDVIVLACSRSNTNIPPGEPI